MLAVAGALSFYAGFPEVAYIDTLLGVGWFLWRCACAGRLRARPFAGKAAAGAAAATLLSAPLLVALLGYLGHADLGIHSTGSLGDTHLPPQSLPQLLFPYVYGPIFRYGDPRFVLTGIWGSIGGYLSSSLLLFGLLGLFSRGRRGLRLTLLIWILLAFSRMYGQLPVLGHLFDVLPGMSRVAFFRYATPSLELAVVIMAALGLDDLARPERPRRLLWAALGSLVVLALAALGARTLAHQLGPVFSRRPYFAGAIAWGIAVVLVAAGISFLRSARARVWLLAALLAGDALAQFAVPELSAPRAVQLDLAPVRFLQRHLGSTRFFTLGPIQPNYGSYFGLAELNDNDLPLPSVFQHYVHSRLDQVVDPTVFVGNFGGSRSFFVPSPAQELERNLAGYRAAAVSYVLTPAGQTLPQSPATFTLVFRSPSTWIYRLAGAAGYFSATTPGCALTSQGRDSVQVSCPRPTWLIRREADLPGWSVEVDRHQVPLHRAGGVFQAIDVGPGSHRITFGYLPPYLGWGLLAFASGCLWLLASVLTGRTAGRSRRLRHNSGGASGTLSESEA